PALFSFRAEGASRSRCGPARHADDPGTRGGRSAFPTCRIRTYVRNWGMTMTAPLVAPAPRPARVDELQARIRGMQATRLDSKAVPTHPALESVLPGGPLREGTVGQVEGSTTLLMALLAGPR